MLTTLSVTPAAEVRGVPWSVVRRVLGGVLIVLGILLLYGSFYGFAIGTYEKVKDSARLEFFGLQGTELVALSLILAAIGTALEFEATAEAVSLPAAAIFLALIPFSLFLLIVAQVNPIAAIREMYRGGLGSWLALSDTLTRASPLMLTGLCTALPMRVGLVIIGGEGAFVIGALLAAGMGVFVQGHGGGQWTIVISMLLAGGLAGGIWIAIAGALKHYRGVNETISSLLLIYIAIAVMNHVVEGAWLDPGLFQEAIHKPGGVSGSGAISGGNRFFRIRA